MKKAIGTIHLWLGLISGLVVFIISITGCIYAFEEELKAWAYKGRETVEVPDGGNKKSLTELLSIAQRLSGEDHPIQNITVSTIPNQSYSFRPDQIRNSNAYTHFGEIVYQHKFYLNPYTGGLIKDENTKYEFFTLVLRLHRNLLLNRSVGKMIIGISVILFVILLISGIVLWWPKNKNATKQRFWFRWKDTTQWKRKNYDLHNVLGFYSLFILLPIALTGLVFSFDWFDDSVQWVVNGGKRSPKAEPLYSNSVHIDLLPPLDQILFEVTGSSPEARTFSIRLPDKPGGVVSISAQTSGIRYTREFYQFDQYSGEQLSSTGFEEKTSGEKLRAMNYDIHVGSILGFSGKLLAFFASLISAGLPVTGFLIWIGRKKKEKNKLQNRKKLHGLNSKSRIGSHSKTAKPYYPKSEKPDESIESVSDDYLRS
ncbi:PepSY-associated TM helix domain-containing protein [Reichenbachiella sp. MALMAid0571]|uniref:PepSY-associated TM helix domain-containing protein n=1 Tax=Reichenbachiella sp. MALMAid0571 TaxID=3143939 RepID=UPI0032E04E26